MRGFTKRLWILFLRIHNRDSFHSTERLSGRPEEARMGQSRKKISPEFRNRILNEIETGQISTSQAARQYQVSRSLIEYWKKRRREGKLDDQTTSRERQLERENRELKAKVGELVMQLEHVKKLQRWVRQNKSADTSVITAENLDQFRKGAK
jgi:transposase-like protein